MRTKVCSRCDRELPVHDFTLKSDSPDGLYQQCRSCKRESQQRWKDKNTPYRQIANDEKRWDRKVPRYEPVRYSRSVCAHVEVFVQRAIERFEKNTGVEAPPHMTALAQLAGSFVKQHPELVLAVGETRCPDCLVVFKRLSNERVCASCKRERQRSMWRHKNAQRKESVTPSALTR